MEKEILLETKLLSKSFSHAGIQQNVLRNLDLKIYKGDFTVIMGSSGAGKSTLLYALSGMDKPTLGDILFYGVDGKTNIAKYSNDRLAIFRRKNCGFIFQDICLNDNLSIMDNVLVAGYIVNKDKYLVRENALQLFDDVKISEDMFKKFPAQLSGGEAQRVGIVRALINNPRIVFADEPTGALNSAGADAVLNLLNEINSDGQSIVMVTHDIKSAVRGNRIIYLKDGSIEGELELDKYDGNADRFQVVQNFLAGMGW